MFPQAEIIRGVGGVHLPPVSQREEEGGETNDVYRNHMRPGSSRRGKDERASS